GYYSDGSSRTLTGLSVSDWHTSDLDTGYFNTPGMLVGGDSPGIVAVTVTKDGITSNTVSVNVTAAVITAIQVMPTTVNVARGQTQQLTAIATYSDNTSSDISNSATWTSDDINTATVTSTGLLSGVDIGTITVTATKGGTISNTVSVNVTAAVITAIQVTPATVNVAKGGTQQLTAMATYSDNSSSDISNSATWTSDDINTATVTSSGLLSAVEVGNTTLTATKDGVTSNTVNVDVCADLASACVDIFDTGSGKLFTNSPSVSYLDSIGGSATNGIYTENGSAGPTGDFYLFTWDDANTLCITYNSQKIGGRTNWRLATFNELRVELFNAYGNMFNARGWPVNDFYWVVTPDGSSYYLVNINLGGMDSARPSSNIYYASCVSEL
ncbi:Ig-like domain-containing protein, partial [Vibrio sp. Vb339]|uniref:Ig-like domain-containing protein n=1 Tax=Vibrio sp. Vb339 TaxID=1192013 RepID=UPI001554995C